MELRPKLVVVKKEQRKKRGNERIAATMAHRILCSKPTLFLTLRLKGSSSYTSKSHHILHHHPFLHSPVPPSSFLNNTHPISLHSTTTTRTTTRTKATAAAIDGCGGGYLEQTDEELMRQCEMGTFKSSGPGGQHRNKRESSVRLKHIPTGIIAQVLFPFTPFRNQNLILFGFLNVGFFRVLFCSVFPCCCL